MLLLLPLATRSWVFPQTIAALTRGAKTAAIRADCTPRLVQRSVLAVPRARAQRSGTRARTRTRTRARARNK